MARRRENKTTYEGRSPVDVDYLVETYGDLIFRLAFTYLKSAHDAEDIVQSVFLKLLAKTPSFNDVAHEKAWVIRVTANLCKDALRMRSRRAIPVDAVGDLQDERPQASHGPLSEMSPVTEAVLSLPDKYREAVFLFYYEGYSTHEIGQILGCSDETVRTRLSRARKKIRQYLEGGGHD